MRLCFIFNQAPSYVEAAYRLFDREFDVKWCLGDTGGGIREMDHSLLKDVTTFPIRRGRGGAYTLEGIARVTKDRSIDAYILLGEPKLTCMWRLPYLIRMRNPRAKIFFWTHGWYGKESRSRAFLKKLFFRPADGILLYGSHARDLMLNEGFRADKLHVIHNSLNYPVQSQLRSGIVPSEIYSRHFGNADPVLVMIGRLTIRKNLDMLLKAVAKLKDGGGRYNIVLIGEGEDRAKLEALAKDLGIERQVWFYGACYDEKTNAELVYNADMCVVPGDIGLTAMHAMMFGCPCITHDFFPNHGPEFESIHQDTTGAFYRHGDIDDLARTIETWFASHRGRREEIRQACYREIDHNWTPEFELAVLRRAMCATK